MSWVGRLLRRAARQPTGSAEQIESARAEPTSSDLLERGIAEYRVRNWALAESLLREAIERPDATAHDREVGRNILGNLLERTGRPSEALAVYQANVAERAPGSYSYERLARLYSRLDRPDEALEVLELAVTVTEQQAAAGRDVALPLARLRQLLALAARPSAGA